VPSDTSLYTNYTRKPTLLGLYLRDKIELAASSLILNLGVRYDYFDPAADFNPNINSEFEQDLEGSLTSGAEAAEVKHMVSPRLSISYPITDQGIIRFSYGHFYQNGSLSQLYRNPFYYSVLGSNPTFGNPNVEPQKSIQYELGLLQGLTEDLRIELTGFYKDVTNYIQQQTVFTPSGKEFSLLSNLAYSNVRGITVSLFKRRAPASLFQASLDYTFQIAEGNRTEPSEDLFYSEVTDKLAEVYLVPLAFDRTHVINATVNLIQPDDWTLGVTGWFQTGTPYTPAFPSQVVAITFEQSSAYRPTNWNVDFKFEKFFNLGPLKTSLFLQVENLFDTENEVFVYSSSGRALSNVEETVNANLLDAVRTRINRGDPGLFGIDQVNNYYSQRPQNVNRPREVLLGFTVLF
jgi:outer membrane receptor protein involved in Fe transport